VRHHALEEHFPPEARWTRPEGGLFLWVELPEGISGEEVLKDAIRERVAFVPGAPFFANDPQHNFIRLNFSNQLPEMIEEGIERIGDVLKRRIK
jgi:2-aminoadipate transaminase